MPIWLHVVVKIRPRRLQEASKTPQDGPRQPKSHPKGAQDALRTAQEAARRLTRDAQEPGTAQEPPRSRPDPIRTKILDHVGFDFGQFLMDASPQTSGAQRHARWRERGFAAQKIFYLQIICFTLYYYQFFSVLFYYSIQTSKQFQSIRFYSIALFCIMYKQCIFYIRLYSIKFDFIRL